MIMHIDGLGGQFATRGALYTIIITPSREKRSEGGERTFTRKNKMAID
jgi:hypothetical protein